MSLMSLMSNFQHLSTDEKLEFLDQLSAAMRTEKERVGNPLDELRAAANDPERVFMRQVHAQAERLGVTLPERGKLKTWQVDKMLRECGRPLSIEDRIGFKAMIARAGYID